MQSLNRNLYLPFTCSSLSILHLHKYLMWVVMCLFGRLSQFWTFFEPEDFSSLKISVGDWKQNVLYYRVADMNGTE